MTPELERELIDAFNAGYCQTEPTALERLRAAWWEATEEERRILKGEILSHSGINAKALAGANLAFHRGERATKRQPQARQWDHFESTSN
jgi:hypothetical protein